jgi:hypothetical protein
MIKLSRMSNISPIGLRLALTCAVSVLAACGQGGSTSNTVANAEMDNSLADAPPPATALPLASGPSPAYGPAPTASALPPAPSARLGRLPPTDQYAYLNQAYAFSQSLADAPPDYTYDYQGERPWVWQSPDGYYRVAERLPMGVRYFYYAPGASEPYLVQDPQYSYGYSGGLLTVVYGPEGQVLPYDVETRQARAAGAYLAWAAALYAAARHGEHVAVSQDRWDAERQAVYADQARWNAAQQRNSAWAAYSQAHQNDQAHFADQRYVRAAEAARFAQAVHDPAALAHAQQAATEARTVAQSRGEGPPGPAVAPQREAGDRRQPGPQQPPATARPVAPVETQDRTATQTHPGLDVQRPAESPGRAQNGTAARTQPPHETQARETPIRPEQPHQVQAHQVQVHQAPVQQAKAPETAQHAEPAHAAADVRRPAAEQTSAPAHEQRSAPPAEVRTTEHVQATHTAAPKPKPKPEPKPDEHRS